MRDGRLIHAETRRRGGDESIDDPVESILQGRRAKVYEEADLQIQEAKVGQCLFGMDRRQPFQRLYLNNDEGLDDQIDAEGIIEVKAIIVE